MNPNINIFAGCLPRWARLLVLTTMFAMGAALPLLAQSEEGIKAAFIYNFAKFTEWPASAFANANAPVTVGFMDADSLADKFAELTTGRNANGRDFAIKKLSGSAGVADCQIVFVGKADQAPAVIAAVNGKPVLTVGDSDGFAAAGGMITFVFVDGKVHFDLDAGAIKAGGLKLDAKLRQIARNVKGG